VGTDRTVVDTILAGAWRRESGVHGEEHWRCVAATGLSLAESLPGCDRQVVFLFGLLHDTRRVNEHIDPEHGPRAASWALELAASGSLALDAGSLDLLHHAIAEHTNGGISDDPTVGVCWDADRLHLPRVSITPDPARFSTALAHGDDPLRAAAALRRSPPAWDALLTLARS
jgi:uncharacterized protein